MIILDETAKIMAKIRLQVTVREDIVKWIDEQVKKLRFASRSHAIEYALTKLREQEKAKNSTNNKKNQ